MNAGKPLSSFRVGLRLLGFLRPYTGTLFLSILSGSAAIAASVGLMATSAILISSAALHPSIAELQVAIVGVRFFGLSRGVFRYLERLLSHSVNLGLLASLRVWLYQRIEPLAPAGLISRTGGDLLTHLVADIETLENYFVRVIAPAAIALLGCLGIVFIAGSIDLHLALALLTTLVLVGLVLPMAAHWVSRSPARYMVELRASLTAALVDGIQGSADILAFNQQATHLGRLIELDEDYAHAQRQMAWIQAAHTGLASLLSNLGMGSVLLIAISLVLSGQLQGTLLAALVLGSLASFELVLPLPLAGQYLETSLQAARRLFELSGQTPAVVDLPIPGPPTALPSGIRLSFHQVSFTYPGCERPALEAIDLELPPGKRIAVVGPSGAGKTTLANLLMRFWDPSSGAITLDGIDVRRLPAEAVRQRMAVIAQSTHLFNVSLRQNLLLARPDASPEELVQAAQRAQIHEFILRLPAGYDTPIGERGLRLSAGERQRIAVARALLKDAPILVLDEPVEHLDGLTASCLMETLDHEVFPGRCVLLITHRLIGLERMHEIVVMDKGRIVERGTQAELLAANGLFCRMWHTAHDLIS
ncbi:MAG TPA: thiol reductant ABC exporter subunit CydC [Anaerolineaceae bacterium]